MTIISRGYYIECDDCGEQFDPPGGDEVTDELTVTTEAERAGWVESEDRHRGTIHLCPECAAAESEADMTAQEQRKETKT